MFKFQWHKFRRPSNIFEYAMSTRYYLTIVIFYVQFDFRIGIYANLYNITWEQYRMWKYKRRGKRMQKHYEKAGELPF